MVGSVLLERMREEGDFSLVKSSRRAKLCMRMFLMKRTMSIEKDISFSTELTFFRYSLNEFC